MRHLVRVLVAVTSLLTVAALQLGYRAIAALGVVATNSAAADVAYVQRLLFSTPLDRFVVIAKGHVGPTGLPGDSWFDWSTDLCSAPMMGNSGPGYNFSDPCRRHDFGYRNTHLLDHRYGAGRYWTAATRKRIDAQFLADMRQLCGHRHVVERPLCYGAASLYFAAVRVAGGP